MSLAPHPITNLFDVIEGPIRFGLLKWAIEEGVFDLCQSTQTPKRVAGRIGADEGRVAVALQTLTSAGYLRHLDGGYETHQDYAPYLIRGAEQCFVQTFLDLSQARHAGLAELGALIGGQQINGSPPKFDADHWQRMQISLQSFHRAVAAEHMLKALETLPEWAGAKTVLDVGGGSFELAQAILAKYPAFRITVYDIPEMVDSLGQPSHDAISVQSGSYNDPGTFPDGLFDVIWCSMSLYFASDGLAEVIGNLAQKVAPGGVFVSFHEDLTEDRCQPARHVVGRSLPAISGKNLSFSNGEVSDAMKHAGLLQITSTIIDTPFGEYRLDAGRVRS